VKSWFSNFAFQIELVPLHPGDRGDDDEEEEEEELDPDVNEAQKMYLHAAALVAGFSFTLGEDDDEEEEEDDDEEEEEEGCGGGGDGTTQAMVPFWDMLNHGGGLHKLNSVDHP
jgi:SET domain-containing protein 6